jgi:glycosyltransferase involved in cell wall biosynthesis
MADSGPVELVLVVPSARREGGGDVWLDGLLRHLPQLGFRPVVVFVAAGPAVRIGGPPGCGGPGRTAWVQHVIPSDFWLHRAASALPTDVVLCVSSAVERRQRELYPQHPTRVVHPGIEACDALPQTEARARLGCAAHASLIGVVGRIEPWKGQDLAIRMLAELVARERHVHLVLLGQRRSSTWPEFGEQVATLARELRVADRVTFTGPFAICLRCYPRWMSWCVRRGKKGLVWLRLKPWPRESPLPALGAAARRTFLSTESPGYLSRSRMCRG